MKKKTQIIQFFQNFFDAGKRKTVTNHANILCSKRFRAKSCVHFTWEIQRGLYDWWNDSKCFKNCHMFGIYYEIEKGKLKYVVVNSLSKEFINLIKSWSYLKIWLGCIYKNHKTIADKIKKKIFYKRRSFWFLFYAFLKIFSLFVLKTNYYLEKPLMLSGQKELLFLEERKKCNPPVCVVSRKKTPLRIHRFIIYFSRYLKVINHYWQIDCFDFLRKTIHSKILVVFVIFLLTILF